MATSDVIHWQTLNRWPVLMRESSWHFNQISGAAAPLNSPCDVYIQSSRDTVAQGLYEAGWQFADALGFFPRPTWTNETFRLGRGWPYSLQEFHTQYRYVEAFGQRASTLITANVAITYSDSNGDGVNDLATMTVTVTAGQAANEVQVFFRTVDGAPAAGDERWQIEPLSVSVVGTTATITGPRYLFVKPSTIWQVPYNPTDVNFLEINRADTADPNDFVTLVDVYRVYNDTTTVAQLLSDPIYSQSDNLGTMLTDAADVLLIDSVPGRFRVRAVDCEACHVFGWVKVFYKSGFPLVNSMMDRRLEVGMVRFANVVMPFYPQEVCDLPQNPTRTMFTEDRMAMPPNELQPTDLRSPFGLSRGAIRLWRSVHHMEQPSGGKL